MTISSIYTQAQKLLSMAAKCYLSSSSSVISRSSLSYINKYATNTSFKEFLPSQEKNSSSRIHDHLSLLVKTNTKNFEQCLQSATQTQIFSSSSMIGNLLKVLIKLMNSQISNGLLFFVVSPYWHNTGTFELHSTPNTASANAPSCPGNCLLHEQQILSWQGAIPSSCS